LDYIPNFYSITNWLNSNLKLGLLPCRRIGLCPADDNLSAGKDSIQARPEFSFNSCFSDLFFICLGEQKRKIGFFGDALCMVYLAPSPGFNGFRTQVHEMPASYVCIADFHVFDLELRCVD